MSELPVGTEEADRPLVSDEELVLGALLGDLDALDELVRRFRGAVFTVARQIVGSREAAEDVAQDTFLTAFRALPQLDDPARFGAWLCAITRHRARKVAAREERVQPIDAAELDDLILSRSSELFRSPEDQHQRALEVETVTTAVLHLPPEEQTILLLYYFEDWSVAQIADFLSLPITTVKWRLHQGRTLLRRRLDPPHGEPQNDRTSRRKPGNQSPTQDALRNRADRQGGQPHGNAARGRSQLRAAI